ncbi:MAG: alpha-E domain-containing protein [Pseudomonadota bacterium]
MLLSKVAERVYWMARYVERAENTARLIQANTRMMLDLPMRHQDGWRTLVVITGSNDLYSEQYEQVEERTVSRFLISDRQNPGSIRSSLNAARENARTLRDILPRQAWECLNELCLYASNELAGNLSRTRQAERLHGVIERAGTFAGALSNTMLHDEAYEFLRIGRNLERADMTTRLIDVRSVNLMMLDTDDKFLIEQAQWRAVLAALSASTGIRRRKQRRLTQTAVLQFVVKDDAFPRSFAYCAGVTRTALQRLPRSRALVRSCNEILERVAQADLARMAPEDLHSFVDQRQIEIADLHARIESTYLQLS